MRRIPTVLLAIALLATACGGGSDGASAGDAAQQAATEPAAATEAEPTAAPTAEPEPEQTAEPTPAPDPTATAEPDPTPVPPTPLPQPDPVLPLIDELGTGPYEVGVQTITVIDSDRGRNFLVDVWFPLADGTTGDLAEYSFITGDSFTSVRALDVDVTTASADGPFPLVVYSHGSGGVRYLHSDYTETIASHGYVVAAPDHPGNTAIERVLGTSAEFGDIALNRPLDVIEVIDVLLEGSTDAAASFTPLIDGERIAVTGHSFGGFTSFATATGFATAAGSSPVDDRIDAIITLAPAIGDGAAGSLLTSEQLAFVEVPVLTIAGTDDITTPIDPHVETIWSSVSSTEQYRLELVAAEHQTFTDLCLYVEALPDDATPEVLETIRMMSVEGCSPDDMPFERAHALTNTFAVTFLDSVFRDGEMFDPTEWTIPDDVIYQVK